MSIQGSSAVTLLRLQNLMDRLGVKGVAQFDIVPHVLPVAIVDGSVTTVGLQALDVPFTAGETTAPAINTRLATGPALPAGQWNLFAWITTGGDSNRMRLRRRNAGDTADIWSAMYQFSSSAPVFLPLRVIVAANEFFVVENSLAGNAGVVYQALLWLQGPF